MVTPAYPFDEFLKHMQETRSQCQLEPDSFEGNLIKISEYMRPLYPDEKARFYKLSRFVLIMQYVAEHVHDFDNGDYAVCGSEDVGALVGDHVLRAVHEMFTTRDLGDLGHGPNPSEALRLADTYRDNDQNDGPTTPSS